MVGLARVDIGPRALIEHFFAISRLLAGKLDFLSAIRAVATEVAQIVPHDHLDVCIVYGDGRFHTAYESGIQTEWGERVMGPVQQSPIRALLMGEVDHILAADACNDRRFHPSLPGHQPIFEHGLRSRIHVPMMVHGEIIGALSCSLRTPSAYGEDDLRNARYIADLLSPYFFALRAAELARHATIVEAETRAREEGLRIGALRLTEALEIERQRIGMDLHDQTLADLTRLVRRLEQFVQNSPASSQALEPVARGLHGCMQDLRQIIEEARPSVLQLFGFAHAVENHLERAIRDSGQSVEFVLTDRSDGAVDRLDPKVATALFRIVQEAINNAVRHADPSHIAVELDGGAENVRIRVVDNGRGLGDLEPRKGSGIENMITRSHLISAEFAMGEGANGSGTQVLINLRPGMSEAAGEPVSGAMS